MTHNQILWVWMRVGTFGFLAFWMMICGHPRSAPARRSATPDADSETKAVGIFALLMTAMLMIFGLLDLQLSNFRDMLFAGFWVGRAGRGPRPDPPPPARQARPAHERGRCGRCRAPRTGGHDRSARRPQGAFQIPSLDGLRAVSFPIVFLAHASAQALDSRRSRACSSFSS